MKLFVSQPMRGKTDEEIIEERNALIARVREDYPDVEVIDSFFRSSEDTPLYNLGESLKLLSEADIAVFAKGWDTARGCRIEHQCCLDYNIGIFVEL